MEFTCKDCLITAELEALCEGVVVIECPNCLVAEIFSNETVVETLDLFDLSSRPMAYA